MTCLIIGLSRRRVWRLLPENKKELVRYRALLAVGGQDFSKHARVISYFQKEYIKTGKLDKRFSKYISQAFQIRNNTDYADFYIVSKSDAEEQYEKAEDFYQMIKNYLLIE